MYCNLRPETVIKTRDILVELGKTRLDGVYKQYKPKHYTIMASKRVNLKRTHSSTRTSNVRWA